MMTQQEVEKQFKVGGAQAPFPPIDELIESVLNGLKELKTGLNGAHDSTSRAHLNAVLSMINAEIKNRKTTEQIKANAAKQEKIEQIQKALVTPGA